MTQTQEGNLARRQTGSHGCLATGGALQHQGQGKITWGGKFIFMKIMVPSISFNKKLGLRLVYASHI